MDTQRSNHLQHYASHPADGGFHSLQRIQHSYLAYVIRRAFS